MSEMELQGLLNVLESLERERGLKPAERAAIDVLFDLVLGRLYPTAPYRRAVA